METLVATDRVLPHAGTSAIEGQIVWVPKKSLWVFAHAVLGLLGVIAFPQWDALAVFLVLTAITICAGHSVGMHRLLIHRSFRALRWVEYLLVWLGTLVGMAGPFGMIRAHDMRLASTANQMPATPVSCCGVLAGCLVADALRVWPDPSAAF